MPSRARLLEGSGTAAAETINVPPGTETSEGVQSHFAYSTDSEFAVQTGYGSRIHLAFFDQVFTCSPLLLS